MFDFAHDQPRIAIVLLNGFSTLSFGAIAEPLRFIADEYPNIAARIELVAHGGRRALSKGGVAIDCETEVNALIAAMDRGHHPQGIFLCSAPEPAATEQERIVRLVRQAVRAGVPLYGIGGITSLIAGIGLLRHSKATVHWKSLAALSERQMDVDYENTLYVADEMIGSCAGELATLDLVINLIARISPAAAEAVANHFLVSVPRCGAAAQPGSQSTRLRHAPEALAMAARLMAEHIEDVLKIQDIAALCGASTRKLERQFQDYLGTSPLRYYRSLRLERALELVSQTNMTLHEVALATGFATTGALNKYFSAAFNQTPSALRKTRRPGPSGLGRLPHAGHYRA